MHLSFEKRLNDFKREGTFEKWVWWLSIRLTSSFWTEGLKGVCKI